MIQKYLIHFKDIFIYSSDFVCLPIWKMYGYLKLECESVTYYAISIFGNECSHCFL